MGRNYTGTLVSDQPWCASGMENPRMFWVPSISPSSLAFYTGDTLSEWKDSLFVGALNGKQLQRISFNQPSQAERREPLLTRSTSASATCSRDQTAISTWPPSSARAVRRQTVPCSASNPPTDPRMHQASRIRAPHERRPACRHL